MPRLLRQFLPIPAPIIRASAAADPILAAPAYRLLLSFRIPCSERTFFNLWRSALTSSARPSGRTIQALILVLSVRGIRFEKRCAFECETWILELDPPFSL